ncbi:DUF4405 domain-containing protein [Roseibium sp.]|uniref:DUF4405 domain-containing protein n=1 Tax=Roseibium sp. TaxID=1936156 RepID=UPI003A9829E0
MPAIPPIRRWATPVTIGSFVLMSATGVVMFFEFEPGLTTVVHQWFSWAFLVGAGAHVAVNWRPLKLHLRSRWGKGSLAVFCLILLASFTSWGMVTGPQLKRPIEAALVNAPISALAEVTHVSTDRLLARLQTHGIEATPNQTLADLVVAHDIDENIFLGIVFLGE